jgi:hypothetical protein
MAYPSDKNRIFVELFNSDFQSLNGVELFSDYVPRLGETINMQGYKERFNLQENEMMFVVFQIVYATDGKGFIPNVSCYQLREETKIESVFPNQWWASPILSRMKDLKHSCQFK